MKNLSLIHPKLKGEYVRYNVYNMVLESIDNEGVPSSTIYMGIANMLNSDQFQILLDSLINFKAIKVKNHYITRDVDYDKAHETFLRVISKIEAVE